MRSQVPILQGIGGSKNTIADLLLQRIKRLQSVGEPSENTKSIPLIQSDIPFQPDILSASNTQKEDIAKKARENQDHYLLMALDDNNKKPWFHYPKHGYQYAEFVLLSVEMAQVMLKHNKNNRHLKPTLVEAYQRDLENDRWIPSDEGIGVNLSLDVFNGQHRLTAIEQSDKPAIMWITWNVLNEAKFVTDSGAKRSVNEKLAMVVDSRLGNKTAALCKAMMRGTAIRIRFSESEVAEFAAKYESVIVWLSRNLPNYRSEVQAVIGKAYLWYGEDMILPFCQRLSKIEFKGDGDPAKALFVFLNRLKVSRVNSITLAYKKTLAAIEAIVEGRQLSKIHEKEEDIFEWGPNWDMPSR
jgi:hypothetical protein